MFKYVMICYLYLIFVRQIQVAKILKFQDATKALKAKLAPFAKQDQHLLESLPNDALATLVLSIQESTTVSVRSKYPELTNLMIDLKSALTFLEDSFTPEAVAFLVNYYLCYAEEATSVFGIVRFNSPVLDPYDFVPRLQPQGDLVIGGCGLMGLRAIDLISSRRLVLIDNDPFILALISRYVSEIGSNVRVLNQDLRQAVLEPNSAGAVIFDFVLHLFEHQELKQIMERFISFLHQDGLFYLHEPEYGCCDLACRAKTEIMQRILSAEFDKLELRFLDMIPLLPELPKMTSVVGLGSRKSEHALDLL
jgi:hypothetical protein